MTRLVTCDVCGEAKVAPNPPPHDPEEADVRCDAFMPGDRLGAPTCDAPFGHGGAHHSWGRYVWWGPA